MVMVTTSIMSISSVDVYVGNSGIMYGFMSEYLSVVCVDYIRRIAYAVAIIACAIIVAPVVSARMIIIIQFVD